MESESLDPQAALEDYERARVLAYTRYPDPWRWYPVGAGLVAAAWVVSFGLGGAWRLAGGAVCDLVIVVWALRYTRRRGVTPRLDGAPAEIRREMRWFLASLVAVLAVTTALYVGVGWGASALFIGPAVALLVATYERRYAAASRAAERSHGIAGLAPR